MIRTMTLILCLLVAIPAPAQAGFCSQIISAVATTVSAVARRATWELDCILEDTDFMHMISVFGLCFATLDRHFRMRWTEGLATQLAYAGYMQGWPAVVERAAQVRQVPMPLRVCAADALARDPKQGQAEVEATRVLFKQEEKETRGEYKELAQKIAQRTVSKPRPLTPAAQITALQRFYWHVLPGALHEAFPVIPEQ